MAPVTASSEPTGRQSPARFLGTPPRANSYSCVLTPAVRALPTSTEAAGIEPALGPPE
jgi:hypothetical protein